MADTRMKWTFSQISVALLTCLISTSVAIDAPSKKKADGVTVEEATVSDLAARMQRGELSSHDLVMQYLDRIATIDR
ncbi:MAG: hypothetical protein ABIY37_11375, partial [Devosia sp.]